MHSQEDELWSPIEVTGPMMYSSLAPHLSSSLPHSFIRAACDDLQDKVITH